MYGLGLAEAELGHFLARRRAQITVTTKFGIDPSAVGRVVGRAQSPMRALLQHRPPMQRKLEKTGSGPAAGVAGRLLYSFEGHSARSAESSLHRSLRALRTDYVDIFVLHEPVVDAVQELPELVAYLDRQCLEGSIRCWGVAGAAAIPQTTMPSLANEAPLLQFKDDIFEERADFVPAEKKATITFGILGRALPALRKFFDQFPDQLDAWSERLAIDLRTAGGIPAVLLREAFRRNTNGPVLFSSTSPDRLRETANVPEALLEASDFGYSRSIQELVAAVRRAYPVLNPTP